MPGESVQPEVKDLIQAIKRYAVANGVENTCFIGGFVTKSPTEELKDGANILMIFGYKNVLKRLLFELDMMVEKNIRDYDFCVDVQSLTKNRKD